MRLKGKVAVITGAGTGIGEAIAHKFALEGANVVVAGLPGDPVDDVVSKIKQHGHPGTAVAFTGDVAEEDQAQACVQKALDAFGKLDVLVNNAGTIPDTAETQNYPLEAFKKLLHNNVQSAFMMTRAALPELHKTRGNIVSAGSEAGLNGTPTFTPYGGTKGFMHAFMKGVAVEQAKHGVRANCVCPGPIDTEMTRPEHGAMSEKTAKMVVKATPLARRGTTEEMANVYAFLASDEASYVTGALFLADGGITIAHGNIGEEVPEELKKAPQGQLELSHELEGLESAKPV